MSTYPASITHADHPPSLWTQALLQEAHDIEVKKQKEEDKIAKQLAVNRADTATEVQRTIPAGPIMEDLEKFIYF